MNHLKKTNNNTGRSAIMGQVPVGLVLLSLLLTLTPVQAAQYLYNLASFDGVVPLGTVGLALDEKRGEVYVANGGAGSVQIFNGSGMEVYSFGDKGFGRLVDLTVLEDGDILLLSYQQGFVTEPSLIRCNYRGDRESSHALTGVPDDFAGMRPGRLLRHGNRLFVADFSRMWVVEIDPDGRFVAGIDLGAAAGLTADQVERSGIAGIAIDLQGRFVFSVPALFTVYRIDPSGSAEAESFGRSGSAPGRFGIVRGIGCDRDGNIYAVDALRCVVLVFDRELRFQNEFGYRGYAPGRLIAPRGIAVAGGDRVYVTQGARRGVSVYRTQHK